MKRMAIYGVASLAALLAFGATAPTGDDYVTLNAEAQPLRDVFNKDAGKVRVLMYVSPVCGGCLRGVAKTQEHLLDKLESDDLAVYVVWAPRNGAREKHLGRVLSLTTDDRATQYWDAAGALSTELDEQLKLTGPCAGAFLVYGSDARWKGDAPPHAAYWEDAHTIDWGRDVAPQFNGKVFAAKVRELLD